MPIKIGNVTTTVLMDSGSACIILSRSLALQVVKISPRAFWIHEKASPQLRNFSRMSQFTSKERYSPQSQATGELSTQQHSPSSLIVSNCRDLFDQLSLAVTQSSSHKDNHINIISSSSEIKEQIAKTFPSLVSRTAISKNHVAKSNFHKDFQPRNQKGRRIPINLQDKVKIELKNLLDDKHITKFSSCPDKFFISPIVVTVKKDQTIKLALDSKLLNIAIHKNKDLMPNIDTLIESISQQTNAPASQNTKYFSTLDLKYAHSQLNLDSNTPIIVILI